MAAETASSDTGTSDRGGCDNVVRLELEARTLARLMAAGLLCVADFRCLDGMSHRRVWHLCLRNAARPGAEAGHAGCEARALAGDP